MMVNVCLWCIKAAMCVYLLCILGRDVLYTCCWTSCRVLEKKRSAGDFIIFCLILRSLLAEYFVLTVIVASRQIKPEMYSTDHCVIFLIVRPVC